MTIQFPGSPLQGLYLYTLLRYLAMYSTSYQDGIVTTTAPLRVVEAILASKPRAFVLKPQIVKEDFPIV